MSALALRQGAVGARRSSPVQPAILAQRRSTLGGGSVAAPAIVGPGRPLEPATRHEMERGFGRDFGSIRIHDDARAHDQARDMGALAYAAGDNIVFAEGRYAPQTAAGRALIAHELAHNVQQGGVQMKAAGPLPAASDARLEAEADAAALAITAGRPAPALSRIAAPAIFRADTAPPVAPAPTPPAPAPAAPDAAATPAPPAATPAATPADPSATPAATPPAAPSAAATTPAPAPGVPSDVEVIEETPKGTGATYLVVSVPTLSMPAPKGAGTWVKQGYDAMVSGKRLIFSPIFDKSSFEASSTIAAYMEKPGEKYKDIWLQKWGFTTLQGMAKAIRDTAAAKPEVKTILDKPEVKKIVDGFALGKLTSAGCDIDHIVEKQVGGTSVPANLQLLVSDKNQKSGRDTYSYMVSEVKRILEPNRKKVVQFQIRFKGVQVQADTSDGSYEIETLLRTNQVTGSAAVTAKAAGTPITLFAGGLPEVISVKATGSTPIDMGEKRLIPGMRLLNYVRTPGSTATSGVDKIEAELASKPMLPGDKSITLSAAVAPAPAAPTAATPAGATPAAAAAPAAVTPAAGESRKLTLDPTKNKDIPFYYPYLSKGKLTKVGVDASGGLSGEGVISPTVKFFGDIKFKFAPDTIEALASIPVENLKTPGKAFFRFTESTLSLQLAPTLIPKGNVKFTVGPAAKPIMNGSITVSVKDGAVIGIGELTPAGTIPGITAAKGEIGYNSQTGWSGKLTATSASIPNSTVTAELGFNEKNGTLTPYGAGGITTKVRGAELFLKVGWDGTTTSYWGGVTIPKPLPMVSQVKLNGSYSGGTLTLTGTAPIKWRSIESEINLTYKRKDGDENGKFSGSASFKVQTEKASGSVNLNYDDAGNISGTGEVSYQVTKDLRPKLGVEYKNNKFKLLGEVVVGDIALSKMWPAPDGARKAIISGLGVKFNIPTPVAGITAYGEVKGSLGVGYGVGPVMLKGVKFNGSLYPFEDDPQITATLTGKLSVPAYGELYGTFGAYIGLEVALGAVGVKGGIEITPSLRITGEGAIEFNAAYADGGFSFSAEAYAKGALSASVKVDLMAEIYAAWGIFSHVWTYPAARVTKQIGPELKITLGKIAYSKEGGITWPSLSQIKFEPENIDPIECVKSLMREGQAAEK